MGDVAEAMGLQKGSLYTLIESKQELLYETMREGAAAFHAALSTIEDAGATERIRLALRAHLRVVAEQLDMATVFVREWRYLEGERRDEIVAERRRYEERFARSSARAASKASCAPTSTRRRRADRAVRGQLGLHLAHPGPRHRRARRSFYASLVEGIRGYATPA